MHAKHLNRGLDHYRKLSNLEDGVCDRLSPFKQNDAYDAS